MPFTVTILGSNSAIPAYNRHPSAQIVHHESERFLIDCGEGTQFRMIHFKIKRANLNTIFISHLHGDHYFGLVGLLNSLRLSGRKENLTIYGPEKLKDILLIQGNFEEENWGFEIIFKSFQANVSELIYENKILEVFTIPLKHKDITCNGFLFKEKEKPRKIISSKITELNIPYSKIADIKNGSGFIDSKGEKHSNEKLTTEGLPSKSYAYCSDTIYDEDLIPIVTKVDLLYHEATFMAKDEAKATERWHSTSQQAAKIAKKSKVKKLIIGHFSARYYELNPLLEEAKDIFKNTALAEEGCVFEV